MTRPSASARVKGSQQPLFPIYVRTAFHIPISYDPLVNANKPKHKYRSHAATILFYTASLPRYKRNRQGVRNVHSKFCVNRAAGSRYETVGYTQNAWQSHNPITSSRNEFHSDLSEYSDDNTLGSRYVGAPGKLIIWSPVKRILFELFHPEDRSGEPSRGRMPKLLITVGEITSISRVETWG